MADDLVKLLFLDSVLSKKSEQERVKKCLATTSEQHFEMIDEVAKRVHLPKNSKFEGKKRLMLAECLYTAGNWLNKSNKPIKKGTNMTFCELREQVDLIASSTYMESQGCEPSYKDSKIGIFWDIHSCPLPSDKYDLFHDKIKALLEEMEYFGDVEFIAVGDPNRLTPRVLQSLANQSILVLRAIQEPVGKFGIKDTTEKQIIVSMLRWVSRYLAKNKEGGVIVVITGDKGIRFAIKEMQWKNFRVVVVHNKWKGSLDDVLLGRYADKVIDLYDLF